MSAIINSDMINLLNWFLEFLSIAGLIGLALLGILALCFIVYILAFCVGMGFKKAERSDKQLNKGV